ncbi:MAG: 2-oxoglutarate dehydrogenase complex dihydrolipoyllysine-residue succinyltransferase [Deltaproteobacteria bacterium]|nr:2-oxoglutarate dehydrogenase complex dihydrolipoyllysine-residue succinyltransferase [Deltaproteobacteria bacterium]
MKIDIVVPAMGESVSEGEISDWLKKEGDRVAADEPIVVIETDKITVDLPSPAAGILAKILKPSGSVVAIGEVLGVIESEGAGAIASPTVAAGPVEPESSRDEAADAGDAALSPAVRRIVEESGVDPAKIQGTGKGGRILKSDVIDHLEAAAVKKESAGPVARAAEAVAKEKPAPAPQSPRATMPPATDRPEERVRMTKIRRRTAERLLAAQSTTASLTTFNDVDLSTVMALRDRYKDDFKKKYGINLGFMSFFIKAAIEALKAFPAVNAMIDGDDIVYHNYYDVGVAVSTDRGLVVPVMRGAERLSFAQTEQAVADLASRARDGRLTMEELSGGTFSITNGGVFGSLVSTPILNPPQSGILGMHRIEKRPIVDKNDQIVIRPMMYLALTYDHRIIDGREAVSFLVRIKQCLEDPSRVLLEI